MDKNKLQVLRELPYRVQRVCGLCLHGQFPTNDWGTCATAVYDHQKHSEAIRQLSITRFGSCPKFEAGSKVEGLGGFKEFL